MSTWTIVSWVFVGLLTGVNIFIFIKLKKVSEQMLKMAFPGAKNMNEAIGNLQKMMGGAGGAGANPFAAMGGMGGGKAGVNQSQLSQAMRMLQESQKRAGRK
ncbi:MAG: hypothetical protein CL678_13200 [Bdellovibrionaceae bacterium]|nr:hypothetical protein [Pseudobdellovibrionaceae bacterium]